MPYPVAHVMFFVFCICTVMIYAILGALFRKELSYKNYMHILLLLFVAGTGALLPDIMAVYGILTGGSLEHCTIGPVSTHSLLFSSSAILFGMFVGYATYRDPGKAAYMGIFAGSAFLSHILLDDLAGYEMDYFYPLYKPISIFSYLDPTVSRTNFLYYELASYVVVLSIFFVIMIALLALSHLGFEFRYKPDK
ncbi:metal-dependent hydrolase [Methanomethylovorans sp.]|uniref:metal-dependent hydrolase n=1 Tax=Methanomethylovorans sp. TaxID=2758717 RepID=UPI00351C98A8